MHKRVLARRTDSFWAERARTRAGSAWWRAEAEEIRLERDAQQAKRIADMSAGGALHSAENGPEKAGPASQEEPQLAPRTGPIQQVPRTELKLHRLLIKLAKNEPPTSPARLHSLHSHDVFRPIVSGRTYSYLLHLAVKSSNQQLANDILKQMDERGIERMESVWRTVLQWRMKVGDVVGVRRAVASLRARGVRPVVTLNWRRDLGETAKGTGDPRRRVWPECAKPNSSDAESFSQPALRKGRKGSQPVGGSASSTTVFDSHASLFGRQQTRLHQAPNKLSHQDIATLIHSLVLDGNAPDAFVAAEHWLERNKPQPKSNPPAVPELAARSRYTSTALVLLNILLRSLVSTSPVPSTLSIRTFVLEFAARHAVRPGEVTLRELVDSYRYRPRNTARRNAWLQAKSMAEWFIRNFGVPGSPVAEPAPASAAPGRAASAHLCSTQVSLLLLNLAVHQPAGPAASKYQREFVWKLRTWWAQAKLHRVVREGTLGQLGNRRAKLLEDAAIRKGLLEQPEGWRDQEEKRKRKKQKEEARDALWE